LEREKDVGEMEVRKHTQERVRGRAVFSAWTPTQADHL